MRENTGLRIVEEVAGCKWTMHVLDQLRKGNRRPGAIKKALPGLSAKVLNERLQKLTSFQLVKKKIFAEIPPRVEYSFTPKGKKFLKVLEAIEKFASS